MSGCDCAISEDGKVAIVSAASDDQLTAVETDVALDDACRKWTILASGDVSYKLFFGARSRWGTPQVEEIYSIFSSLIGPSDAPKSTVWARICF